VYGRISLAAVVAAMSIALMAASAAAHRGTAPRQAPAKSSFGLKQGCKTPLGIKPCWVAGVYNGDYTGMDDRDYLGPPAQASGGHPFVGVTDFIVANKNGTPTGTVKTIRVAVPPGLASNPQATPKCSEADLTAQKCPADTQLGIVELQVYAVITEYLGESVYNLAPSKSHCAGYTADYAFYVALLKKQVDVCGTVRKDPPYNLYFTIKVPSGASLVRSTLIFWGVPGDSGHDPQRGWSCLHFATNGPCTPPKSGPSNPKGTAFLTNPTGCVPKGQITRLTLTSTTGQKATGKSKTPVPAIDCKQLPFAPALKLGLSGQGQTTGGKHPKLTATATQTAGQANIKLSRVTLPLSLALDPKNSEHVCSVKHARADRCPASTIVGSAQVRTPLVSSPLAGHVYLVQGYRNFHGHRVRSYPALLVALRGRAAIDLHAQTSVNPHAQLVTTFAGLPDLPMSSFKLMIGGGKRGILVLTRNLCRRTQRARAVFTGHNGATKRMTVTIGTPCKAT
jgi:hypothetical protein